MVYHLEERPYSWVALISIIKGTRHNVALKSIISRSGFSQMVTSPTRITVDTASLIDLILTNKPHNITDTIAFKSGNYHFETKSKTSFLAYKCIHTYRRVVRYTSIALDQVS